MKRNINNPYVKIPEYNCFACSPKNDIGLKMQFYEEGDLIKCDWAPKEEFCGYHNILHGGIQSTLMDEIASWTMMVKLKKAGVTSKMDVRYKKPVYANTGPIHLESKIIGQKRNLIEIKVYILDNENSNLFFIF